MTNNAYRRLLNEWNVNKYNEDFLETCKKHGIDPTADYIDTVDMIGVRKVCKAKGVWLENLDEEWVYLELMPFGGYNGKLDDIKAALKEYRNAESKFGIPDYLIDKYVGRKGA